VSVILDTCVLSLLFRRQAHALNTQPSRLAAAVADHIATGSGVVCGIVRQELLSGIADPVQFTTLRERLRAWDDTPLALSDYERAAEAHNQCRAAGVAGSTVDFLLCGLSLERNWPIFTTDTDFARYAKVLPLRLWRPASLV
jgi:predicted nucleic acid-binding protein